MKWIDVRDRLPVEPEQVKYYYTDYILVATKWGDVSCVEFSCGKPHSDGEFWYKFEGYPKDSITHWMPFPDPP